MTQSASLINAWLMQWMAFNRWQRLLPSTLSLSVLCLLEVAVATAQTISPALDGTGTIVLPQGDRYEITGGQRSRDGTNLFHSFQQFGLTSNQIAQFLSHPQIQNILGRVVGGEPSSINGLIQVTGGNSNLFLVNPAGIVFGPNASLNVPASFSATTASGIGFAGNWFQALGNNLYPELEGSPTGFAFSSSQPGSIVNFGNLRVAIGQDLSLLGGTVLNLGSLTAPEGTVTIAAVPGETLVRLNQPGSLLSLEFLPLTSASLPAPPPFTPLSLPQLLTGGEFGNATTAIVQPDGSILLTGSQTSIPTTTGTAIVAGRMDGSGKTGGNLTVIGDRVAIQSASLEASGQNGGGQVRLGGDYQGQAALPQAAQTYISEDSTIQASALETGQGGRVIVWSEEVTWMNGTIAVRGGSSGGNGGFVETSSRENLSILGQVDASAPNGVAGSWLLDPNNIRIQATGPDSNVTPGPIFSTTGDNAIVSTASIQNALNLGTDVTIATAATGTAEGNITVADAINKTAGGDATLTLNAINTVNVAGNITSSSGRLNLTLNADSDNSGEGAIIIQRDLLTNGGNITAKGTTAREDTSGISVSSSLIDTRGGTITFNGISTSENPDPLLANQSRGIAINGNQINSGGGAISLNGDSTNSYGISISGSINSQGGTISVNGNTVNSDSGIIVFQGIEIKSEGGNISFNGQADNFYGILIFDAPNGGPPSLNSGTGNLTLRGTSNGIREGLRLENANIGSDGGDITLIGQSNQESGLSIANPIDSNGGSITLTGQSNQSFGINIADTLNSNGGNITLTGQSNQSFGINIADTLNSNGGNIQINADRVNLASSEVLNVNGGSLNLAIQNEFNLNTPLNIQGNFNLTSPNPLTLSTSIATNGGSISLRAPTINTRGITLNSGSTPGNGGAISLIASQGDLVTGDVTSSGVAGGAITLISPTAITTGRIDSSGRSGNGGNVLIDPIGDVQVGYINAQGGATGRGGTIDITAGRFFRAVDSFTDQNGISASLSTRGGQAGGTITLRHGGGPLGTFFEVGNATTNGTAAAITTGNGNTITPNRSFLASYLQGDIQILTGFNSSSINSIQEATPLPLLSVTPFLPALSIDQLFTLMEDALTQKFVAYLELSVPPSLPTLTETQATLNTIASQTGVPSALLYVSFRSAGDLERSPNNATASSQNENTLELLLVTGNGTPVYKRIPGASRAAVVQMAATFRQEVADPSKTLTRSYLPSARQLYDWIITPIEAELKNQGIRNLALILDDGLRFIPIAALHSGDRFLIEQYSLGLMPSFSLTDTRYGSLQKAQLLAAGAAQFAAAENPLPAVPLEINTLTQQIWPGRSLLNQTFTLQNLKTQRQRFPFSMVHLATHGRFLPGDSSQSYIQFWDGRLNLNQWEQLGRQQAPLELITLSACQMALGDADTELGFAGFAVKTGAKSALASLWNISDEGTAGLMIEFYQQLRRSKIKADALQQTQIAMLRGKVQLQQGELLWSGGRLSLPPELTQTGTRDFSHPYYWAAFTMIGSPW